MQIDLPTPLLGGLSPEQFMRKHWQKKPLLVRQAFTGATPPASLKELAALAARDDVESRLVTAFNGDWQLKHGPMSVLGCRFRRPMLVMRHVTMVVTAKRHAIRGGNGETNQRPKHETDQQH